MLLTGFPLQVIADDIPDIRLSGTFISKTETNAIIEYSDGTHRLVEQGDMIDSWGRIIRIEKTRIILQTEAGDFTEVMSEGANSVEASSIYPQVSDPQVSDSQDTQLNDKSLTEQQTAQPQSVSTYVSSELLSEIYFLTRQDKSVGEDLNRVIAKLLKLPPSARIVEVDHKPLSEDATSLHQVEEALTAGSVVRFSIKDAAGLEAVYLAPDPNL